MEEIKSDFRQKGYLLFVNKDSPQVRWLLLNDGKGNITTEYSLDNNFINTNTILRNQKWGKNVSDEMIFSQWDIFKLSENEAKAELTFKELKK